MSGKTFWGLVVAVLVIAGVVLVLNQNKTQTTSQPTATQASPTKSAMTTTPETTVTAMMEEGKVTINKNGFSPQTVTIKAGEKVTWTNKSGESVQIASDPHPTHTNYPPLNLGMVEDGGSVSLIFPKAGTYGYHNHLIPSQKGTVVVE